jgi:hypothetical protein
MYNAAEPIHEVRPKLSTIVKHELFNVPQTHGSFSDGNGKYCVLAAVAKYFGYDVESNKDESAILASESVMIPMTIIDQIESCIPYRRIEDYPCCNCKTKNYFHCNIMSLLIHLNDYHQMTFQQIGGLLEDKGL